MLDRRLSEKATFGTVFEEVPLLKFDGFEVRIFAVSVNASTDREMYEKMRNANTRNKHIELITEWRNGIENIVTFLT